MDTEKWLADLDRIIAREEKAKRGIEQLTADLRRLRSEVERASYPGTPTEESKTNFAKVAEFLLSRGNRPQSAKAIMDGTGIPWGTLAQLLYRSHKDHFVSTTPEGYSRKRLWSLAEQPGQEVPAAAGPGAQTRPTLFGPVGDLANVHAADCCARIFRENGNRPLPVLTLAREALRRGYVGGATGEPDEVLYTTAKSFWAKLGRDERFVCVKGQVFRLAEGASGGTP